jgi:UDP-N-acetylmuramoyl-tripeptide--D-alanyl-D-alanine ligase
MTELSLTLGFVATAAQGTLLAGDPARVIREVGTDSRTVQAGDLFIAIRGPHHDGHRYVQTAAGQGAAGAMVARGALEQPARHPHGGAAFGLVEVDDTIEGLQSLARTVRREAGSRVIAITGSAGKTTTKEAIAAFLGIRFRVVRNPGNLNNHIGLPLSLLQLRTRPDVAVMELGMNHAGEIRRLVAIAEPEVRVWTNVGDAHLGFFASPDAIADAKAEILEGAAAEHLLVCNADDRRVMARVARFPGRVMTFGASPAADVRLEQVEDLGVDGMRARIVTPRGAATIETRLLGRGNLANVAAAVAVAIDAGVPLEALVRAAASLQPAARRGAVHRLRGITLVDDSYNSSPSALVQSLDVVARARARGAGGAVAVIGEMLELGTHADAEHARCGRAAAAAGLRRLFTIGGRAAAGLGEAAVAAGMPAAAVAHFASSDAAASAIARAVESGDLVLVKGSRGVRTDVVADRLMAEFG